MKSTPACLVLLLLLALPTAAQPAPEAEENESSLDDRLRTVATLTAAGDYSKAMTLIKELLADHPDSLPARIAYQDLRRAGGASKELIKEYASAASGSAATPDYGHRGPTIFGSGVERPRLPG
jgi:hypothetical protein